MRTHGTAYIPYVLPPKRNRRQQHRRPWNIEPSCVLALMPEVNTTWVDYSGHGNHATLTNTALRHSGRYGPALYFDGAAAYGEIADSAELQINTPFSVSLWAKRLAASVDGFAVLMDKCTGAANRNYMLFWANAGIITFRVRDVTNGVDRNTAIAGYNETGVWRHLCGVYDGTNINIYVDGVVGVATAVVGTIATGAQSLKVGKLGYAAGSNYMFNGLMDEILIFNKALTVSERAALFEMGKRS